MWIIDLLVIYPSPHLGTPTRPFTLKMLRTKEHTRTLHLSVVFTFGVTVEFIKEFGGASIDLVIRKIHLKNSHSHFLCGLIPRFGHAISYSLLFITSFKPFEFMWCVWVIFYCLHSYSFITKCLFKKFNSYQLLLMEMFLSNYHLCFRLCIGLHKCHNPNLGLMTKAKRL